MGALYDGVDESTLQRRLDVPRLSLHDAVSSTMDVAHVLASAGAPAGTLVLANSQTAGRGRSGRRWASAPAAGLWFTILERPLDPVALRLLSLRVGLRIAAAIERHASTPVRLKWPNDVFLGTGKIAGVLTEARWANDRPEWVAVGVGLNVVPPADVSTAAALGGVSRIELLAELVPAVRGAASSRGSLTSFELAAYAARDLARGHTATSPGHGRVAGIDSEGHLLIVSATGTMRYTGGSLVLEDAIA